MNHIERPVVIPLYGITPDGQCACGIAECKRVGKHAACLWRDVAYGSAVPRPAPGAGVGLKTGAHPRGSDVIVVDLDSEDAADLWADLGGCAGTFTVATPRGYHIYFRHPGFHVKNSASDLGKGIDLRGDGGFVVAEGSPHASGGTYEVCDDSPIADAPEWLLAWLRKQKAPTEAQAYPGDVTEPKDLAHRRALYTEYLKTDAVPRGPNHRGQGDAILFDVVQKGAYDLALPVADVLELVAEHYDPRCSPMHGAELEERVHHKARDAKTNSTRPRIEPLPWDLAHLGVAPKSLAEELQEISKKSVTIDESIIDPDEAELKIQFGGWDIAMPPAVYTIEPIVPEATLGVIVAKGSSLKTWLVLSMLAAVARGEKWLGQFPTVRCPTLLVDFESGREIIQERMQYLRLADTPNLGHASFPNARIDDPKFWIRLTKVVLRRGIRLVAIDSFAAGATGVDENDANSALPLHHSTKFMDATKCGVVLIHHAKKGEGGDERDLMRGSGAIYGAADWAYTMIPQDEDRTKMLFRCIKAFRRKTEDICVSLTIDGLVLDVAAPDEGAKAKAEALRQDIVRALIGGPIATKSLIDRALGKKSGTCGAEVDAMLVRRELADIPGKGYTLDNPAARLARIKAACSIPGIKTAEGIAKAACVDVAEVQEVMAEGKIYPSGSGLVHL